MTNPYNCANPIPPSYSGVTINIANPGVNLVPGNGIPTVNYMHQPYPQGANPIPAGNIPYPIPPQAGIYSANPQVMYTQQASVQPGIYESNPTYINKGTYPEPAKGEYNSGTQNINNIYQTIPAEAQGLPPSYPQQYYVSDYETGQNNSANQQTMPQPYVADSNSYNSLPEQSVEEEPNTETSREIISELDQLQAEQKAAEENSKKTKVVALTNEYIMSLENYLDNPNSEIRLMAAKEVLTRLDEDRSRYDDAALNALLNKMLQDPNKIIRIAALSAFSSELASGNEFTFQILNKIQQNPDADPQDVLEASQILLQRAATTEVKTTPTYNNPGQGTNEEQ